MGLGENSSLTSNSTPSHDFVRSLVLSKFYKFYLQTYLQHKSHPSCRKPLLNREERCDPDVCMHDP